MHVRTRLVPAGLASLAIAVASAAPAQAGVLAPSGVNCSTPTASQVFLPWADPASYTLLPGGDFESGAAGWTLSGGAAVVPGNESYYVGSSSDSNSLSLPAGSSATSAVDCVGLANPDIRFFAQNTGDPSSTLTVTVNYDTVLGSASTTIGVIGAGGSWQPVLQEPILANLLPLLPNAQTPVTFTFTPQGAGNWQIDDVYVDPWGKCC